MTINSSIQRKLIFLGSILVLIGIGVRLLPGLRIIDDAYITFRYVENILDGNGFAFNPGIPVLGTTTPFYTLLLTSLLWWLSFTGVQITIIAITINALMDGITCLVLWRLGAALGANRAGFATAILWALAPFSVTFSIGGLETSVFCFLLTSSVYAYIKEKTVFSALLSSLAILTRPDAVILVGLLSIHFLTVHYHKKLWDIKKEAIAFFAPLGVWFLAALIMFGSPIPNSVQAKLAAYNLAETDAFVRFIQHFSTPFMHHYLTGAFFAIAIGIILYPFLFLVGAYNALKVSSRALPFVIYPWLYLIIFSIANPLIFRWYLTPPLPAYFLFILIGAETVTESLFTKLNWQKPAKSAAVWLTILILPLITSLSAWEIIPDHGPKRPAPQMAWIKLELIYQNISMALIPDLDPDTIIAAADVGTLGYITKAQILDTVGLNSPQSSQYYPLPEDAYVINYAIPADLILNQQPDIIVFLEVYGRNTLLKNDQFLETYKPTQTIPTNIYGSKAMYVYQLTTEK